MVLDPEFMDNGVNSVFLGVGGSFDVLSGHIKLAPYVDARSQSGMVIPMW